MAQNWGEYPMAPQGLQALGGATESTVSTAIGISLWTLSSQISISIFASRCGEVEAGTYRKIGWGSQK